MKSHGEKVLNKIQKILTVATPHSNNQTPKKSAKVEPQKVSVSPKKPKFDVNRFYIPNQKQIKQNQHQTQLIYEQLSQQKNFYIQNNHSYFLNQKHPKRPLYERATEIIAEREAYLEQLRKQQYQMKLIQQEEEQRQFLNQKLTKRVSKQQAEKISDKLFKNSFTKMARLNLQKMQRFKEDAKHYRSRPFINDASKTIYQQLANKNKLQSNIIDRFQQYEAKKKEFLSQINKEYQQKYYPFAPKLSETTKRLVTYRKQKKDGSPNTHCVSCSSFKIKSAQNLNNINYSPIKTKKQQNKSKSKSPNRQKSKSPEFSNQKSSIKSAKK